MLQINRMVAQSQPTLYRDRSFWSMIATQLLGAFNDNLFKQLILLLCVDWAMQSGGTDLQHLATALFAIPFILFSGFAGYISDRTSKKDIVVLCKVAELAIMLLGAIAFALGSVSALFVVLFLMGSQSAFFGPPKYGILPEMLHDSDLPRANGVMQMTTFIAIIFGTASAGYLKGQYANELWIVSAVCVLIAAVGTATSLGIGKTAVAHPGLRFELSSLAVHREAWRLLLADRAMFSVLMFSSLFWFVGGVVAPVVNYFGKTQLKIGDEKTSTLLASLGVGIAIGCLVAGRLSRGRVDFRLVTAGAWGIVIFLTVLALPGFGPAPNLIGVGGAYAALIGLGIAAGFYAVPLQVFLQARPPDNQKGRVIGAMNLINWIGILLAAGFYGLSAAFVAWTGIAPSWIFAATAIMMLPVALFFHPHNIDLAENASS